MTPKHIFEPAGTVADHAEAFAPEHHAEPQTPLDWLVFRSTTTETRATETQPVCRLLIAAPPGTNYRAFLVPILNPAQKTLAARLARAPKSARIAYQYESRSAPDPART